MINKYRYKIIYLGEDISHIVTGVKMKPIKYESIGATRVPVQEIKLTTVHGEKINTNSDHCVVEVHEL